MRPPPAGGATRRLRPSAGRLGLDEREAIALATDCAAAGYVQLNVKGPPYAQSPESATLTDSAQWPSGPLATRPGACCGKAVSETALSQRAAALNCSQVHKLLR